MAGDPLTYTSPAVGQIDSLAVLVRGENCQHCEVNATGLRSAVSPPGLGYGGMKPVQKVL